MYIITDEERIEDASFGDRFKALNKHMKIRLPDYTNENSAERHLFNLEVDIYRIKRIYEKNSPVLMIQSLFRGAKERMHYNEYYR